MNHIDLTAYPFPEGMDIPRLMPEQDKAFNGDGYAAAEVLRLKSKHGLKMAMETGTCLGSTALWLSDNFDSITTVEADERYFKIARARFDGRSNIRSHWERSVVIVALSEPHDFYFLDAHWGEECPLIAELEAIYNRPVIMIHDFQVPGREDLGHDKFPGGSPFSLPAIAPQLDRIYGVGGWSHYFNSQAEGACRGILYVEPK